MLPSELLSRIFLFVLSSNANCSRRGRQDPAMVVSSVCSRWRQIAVTTRSLWSHIHFCPSVSTSNNLPECSRGTELWLERAGATPLHIHVLPTDRIDQNLPPQQISALESHLPFISSLELQTNNSRVLVDSLLFITQANALKYLNISFTKNYGPAPDCSWSAIQFRGMVDLQLTGLSAGCAPSLDQLTSFLADSESLQVLRLRNLELAPGTPTTIHLPCLRLLDVTGLDYASMAKLLPVMTLGDAELDLRVTLSSFDRSSAFEELLKLATRSNVVSLFISNSSSLRGYDPLRLILSTPLLRVLVVEDRAHDFQFLKQLVLLVQVKESEQDEEAEQDEESEQGEASGQDGAGDQDEEPEPEEVLVLPNLHTLALLGYDRLYKAEFYMKRFADMYSLNTIILEDCEFAVRGMGTYEDYDEYGETCDYKMERITEELGKQVEVVCQTNEALAGDMGQVDLNIKNLMRYSSGMYDMPLIMSRTATTVYARGSWQS